jgi:regulator of sigma E protease
MPTILIIILSLVILILLHELGHFFLAKKYGVRVDEFGIGIPPRLFGKKIGETLYSVNLLPLGGFVKLYGEDEKKDGDRSFSSKPIYQRALIVFGGVAAFFVIAFLIFSVQAVVGVRSVVEEEDVISGKIDNTQIVITGVINDSPAREAGVKPGDVFLEIQGEEVKLLSEAQETIKERKGVETEMKFLRGEEEVSVTLTPREEYEEGEGAVGIAMAITAVKAYPLYYAPVQGAVMTGEMTYMVLSGFGTLLYSLVSGKALPPGMEIGGPVAIVNIGTGAFTRGATDFLQFLGAITISLAVLNILPIPALDGGRLVFLGIEKIKGSPLAEKVEYGLNAIFFLLLIGLMIFITFKDLGF